jgi:putative transposase
VIGKRYEFIESEASRFTVNGMCEALCVSRSGYYSHGVASAGPRAVENLKLGEEIGRVHEESRGVYGSPRVTDQLRIEGWNCGENRVARIMRENGIQGVWRKRRRVSTTNSRHGHRASPNLVKDLEVTRLNEVWVADITYIAIEGAWVYLAVVLDLHSRKIIGWKIGPTLEATLAVDALSNALSTRPGWERGLVFHSDRGVQYACNEFRALLETRGLAQSMSAKGNCYDNATMESFFGTMKAEEASEEYRDLPTARLEIFSYIETFYNTKRIHTSIGRQSPVQFETGIQGGLPPRAGGKAGTDPRTAAAGPSGREFSKAWDAPAGPPPSSSGGKPAGSEEPADRNDRRSHRPVYPLEGCSPAEPSSVSPGSASMGEEKSLHKKEE